MMRKSNQAILSVLLVSILVAIVSCGGDDTASLEKLGETVVSSLQNQDIETYLSLFATADDLLDEYNSYPDSLKESFEKMIKDIENNRDKYDYKGNSRLNSDLTKEFYEIAKDPYWLKSEVVRIEVDTLQSPFVGVPKKGNITVYFKGHKSLQISRINKFINGWRINNDHNVLNWN